MELIGINIKRLRKQRGLVQEELAKALGLSDGAISSWERGNTTPSAKQLERLSLLFGQSVSYFFQMNGETDDTKRRYKKKKGLSRL